MSDLNDLRTSEPGETRRSTYVLEPTSSTFDPDEKRKCQADEDAEKQELEGCHSVVSNAPLTGRSLLLLGMRGLRGRRNEINTIEPRHIGERTGGCEY